MPPGPPVLQTLVAEIYGPDYERQIEVARKVREILDETTGVVDVDWYVEDDQPKYRFVVDKEKAALSGVSPRRRSRRRCGWRCEGASVGLLHDERRERGCADHRFAFPARDRSSDRGPEAAPR